MLRQFSQLDMFSQTAVKEMVLLDIYINCINKTHCYLDHGTGTHQIRTSILYSCISLLPPPSPILQCCATLINPAWIRVCPGPTLIVGGGGGGGEGESLLSVLYHQNECYQQSKILAGN